MQQIVDHCETAADVWAAKRANMAWRLAMFAPIQPRDTEPEPELHKPEPIEIPQFLPGSYWTGFQWAGNFSRLVAENYPQQYAQLFEPPTAPPVSRPTVWQIIRRCAALSGVSICDLISARRTDHLVIPRHVAMATAKHFTLQSLPAIGRAMGGRDHTTVLHAIRKMEPVIEATKASLPEGAGLNDWISAALAFARANKLESCHARRERLTRLKDPLMVSTE